MTLELIFHSPFDIAPHDSEKRRLIVINKTKIEIINLLTIFLLPFEFY